MPFTPVASIMKASNMMADSRRLTDTMSGTYKINSLTGLEKADARFGHIVWDVSRSLWNNFIFLCALILAPQFISVSAVIMFFSLTAVTLCMGHSVGFHRRLVHQSFDCPKWLERILVYIGTIVGMGGPLWTMRFHDTRDWSQRQNDCHPYLRHEDGFIHDGLRYLNTRLVLDNPPIFTPDQKFGDDRFYKFLDRTYMAQQIPIAIILYMIGGLPWLVWGVFVRVAACTFMHWVISYVAHTRGPSDWEVEGAVIQAYNVPLLAIPTMGESWHANHHAFPASARHGIYPGQIDLGWEFIKLLKALGLAWDIQTPDTLPARQTIRPMTDRAMDVVSESQRQYLEENR